MKKYILSAMLLILSTITLAQTSVPSQDEHFKFDKNITDAENRWVIFPKNSNATNYPFGFIYIDPMAGFTFDLQGFLTVADNGKFITDTAFQRKRTSSMKYRLDANAKKVAIIGPEHFAELNIPAEPDWLKSYKSAYIDDAAHNYRKGFIYNGAGDSEKALPYLNKAEKEDPLYKGLAFEIIYAYNALKRFPEAEKYALKAIRNDNTNLLLYRELGYAYLGESNFPKAIESMKNGLDNCPNANSNERAELSYNLAKAYNMSGNIAEYKNWATKAKEWSAPNSPLYKYLVSIGI